MRQLGSLPDQRSAARLSDYLLTLGIETRIEQAAEGWTLWVYNEDRLPQAREELAAFVAQPNDPRYATAAREADALRQETLRKQAAARRNMIEMRDRWTPIGMARSRPLTMALILISVVVTLATNFGARKDIVRHVAISNFVITDNGIFGRKDLHDVEQGEVWRLITPIFVHYDVLHLLFNMLWLYSLGGILEMRYGTRRLAWLVLLLAVLSNLGEFYGGGTPFFGGMSGVVYGLLGYIWIKSRLDPTSGLYLSPNTVFFMILWFFLCLTGQMGPVANWAHGVGLAAGIAIAGLSLLVRRRW